MKYVALGIGAGLGVYFLLFRRKAPAPRPMMNPITNQENTPASAPVEAPQPSIAEKFTPPLPNPVSHR